MTERNHEDRKLYRTREMNLNKDIDQPLCWCIWYWMSASVQMH